MKLFKYDSYSDYVETQVEGNIRKLNLTWVEQDTVAFISTYLSNRLGLIAKGICHGTRNGKEQMWFRGYLNADVIGTDISPTANEFENTIEFDFHETKEEWIGAFDFVYSNTLDHAYDPEKALKAWMSCLKPEGCVVLQWARDHKRFSKLDPFAATLGEYIDMIYNLKINISAIIQLPNARQGWMVVLTNESVDHAY